ncbi:MAG: hypothetical protein WC484_07600, partial [Candidatus Omnitrophota bacterium]
MVDRLTLPSTSYKLHSTSQSKLELKEWRDEVIRKLAAEGRVVEHNQYTHYIDQALAGNSAEFQTLKTKWTAKLEKFIEGLQFLHGKNQLTELNVAKLLGQPANQTPYAVPFVLGMSVPESFLGDRVERIENRKKSEKLELSLKPYPLYPKEVPLLASAQFNSSPAPSEVRQSDDKPVPAVPGAVDTAPASAGESVTPDIVQSTLPLEHGIGELVKVGETSLYGLAPEILLLQSKTNTGSPIIRREKDGIPVHLYALLQGIDRFCKEHALNSVTFDKSGIKHKQEWDIFFGDGISPDRYIFIKVFADGYTGPFNFETHRLMPDLEWRKEREIRNVAANDMTATVMIRFITEFLAEFKGSYIKEIAKVDKELAEFLISQATAARSEVVEEKPEHTLLAENRAADTAFEEKAYSAFRNTALRLAADAVNYNLPGTDLAKDPIALERLNRLYREVPGVIRVPRNEFMSFLGERQLEFEANQQRLIKPFEELT